jgi:ABC-type multidrug transport system fused ATPase/permease subunit
MDRILKVVRLQNLNKMTFIGIPLIILGGAFVLSLLIFALIPVTPALGYKFAGGAPVAPMWYFMGAGIYALTLTFPFSQAMSVTRRDFYLGTMATAALASIGMSLIFTVGGYIEQAFDGWGLNGRFFRIPGLWDESPWLQALTYFTAMMLLFTLGFVFTVIYRRWGRTIMLIVLLGIIALILVLGFVAIKFGFWVPMFEAIAGIGLWGWTFIGIGITAVLAVLSYLPLRRTVA